MSLTLQRFLMMFMTALITTGLILGLAWLLTTSARTAITESNNKVTHLAKNIQSALDIHAEASGQRSCATAQKLDRLQQLAGFPLTQHDQNLTAKACQVRLPFPQRGGSPQPSSGQR
jgi:cbb3-type cytochrome oxidase subunit 3